MSKLAYSVVWESYECSKMMISSILTHQLQDTQGNISQTSNEIESHGLINLKWTLSNFTTMLWVSRQGSLYMRMLSGELTSAKTRICISYCGVHAESQLGLEEVRECMQGSLAMAPTEGRWGRLCREGSCQGELIGKEGKEEAKSFY